MKNSTPYNKIIETNYRKFILRSQKMNTNINTTTTTKNNNNNNLNLSNISKINLLLKNHYNIIWKGLQYYFFYYLMMTKISNDIEFLDITTLYIYASSIFLLMLYYFAMNFYSLSFS